MQSISNRFADNQKAIAAFCFVAIFSFLLLGTGIKESAQAKEPLPYPMMEDPAAKLQEKKVGFQPGLVPIWLKALAEDNRELRIQAADAIRRASAAGLTDCIEAKDELIEIYKKRDEHLLVRIACARALVQLDAKESLPHFEADLDESAYALRRVIEPALGQWKSEKGAAHWKKVLSEKSQPDNRLMLAIDSMGNAIDPANADAFRGVVFDLDRNINLRLAAARAYAAVVKQGSESTADQLTKLEPSSTDNFLLAATVLTQHSSPEAIERLQKFAVHQEPAVGLVAVRRLAELDLKNLYGQTAVLSKSRDSEIRAIVVQVLKNREEVADQKLLVEMMNDSHPKVRHDARIVLEGFAKSGKFDNEIRKDCEEILTSRTSEENWRMLEQTLLLVASLDHEPAVESVEKLLTTKREEICVTAAFTLQKLNVPASYPRLLDYARKINELGGGATTTSEQSLQLAHIFQLFGIVKYKEAESLLRVYVPKNNHKYYPDARAGAVWALGHILQDTPDPKLEAELAGRVIDTASSPAEAPIVRRMSAASLGRMRSKASLENLRKATGVDPYGCGYVAAWAIEQITGEPIPPVEPYVENVGGWFLRPISKQ